MITDAEIARARTVPIADLVASFVPLKRDFALCIWHNEKTPSMHVDRKRNIVHCFGCGRSADTISFLRQVKRLDFSGAVAELIGGWQASQPVSVSTTRASRSPETPSLVLDLWRGATAPRLASWYLESRGIGQKSLPEALRGHPRVWCSETGGYRPAMLAAISDGPGSILAVQRTWLEDRLTYDGHTEYPKGARATCLADPKKTLGPMGVGAVRLAAAGSVLGLAEGVESALAAAKLFRIPVWATCSATRLGNVELPQCVSQVVIFGDPDEPGRASAAKAEMLYRRRGYSCQVEMPEKSDWNALVLGL